MGSVGTPELLVIFVLALIVLGPERLPGAARTVGRWVGELRKLTGSLQAEVRTVVDDVVRPVNEAATAASTSGTSWSSATEAGGAGGVDAAALFATDAPSTAAAAPAEASGALAADVPLVAPPAAARPVDPSLN